MTGPLPPDSDKDDLLFCVIFILLPMLAVIAVMWAAN